MQHLFTRRDFLSQSALGLALAGCTGVNRPGDMRMANHQPTQPSEMNIRSVVRRDDTLLRLGGVADNFHMTWADNDQQFVTANDGFGWHPNPKGYYNSRLAMVAGQPQDARFQDVETYPDLIFTRADAKYYSMGTIALQGRIFQFLSTYNHSGRMPDGRAPADFRFIGAKLIYSPDNGRTWCNQDGSTPVVWENWYQRSRQTLAFFEEDQDAFSLLSILQMGRNYSDNLDGYVYVYSPNGTTEGTMNELVMFRAPKDRITDRGTYEYFAGLLSNGQARWSSNIMERKPTCTFPSGWVNKDRHPWAWLPSVCYNAPLGLFMMANWATGPGPAPEQRWFQKPSYLGFWVSRTPWGPWTQIYEDTAWAPGGDTAARCYSASIAPKWISEDGRSFWLVWSDFQSSQAPEVMTKALARPGSTPSHELEVFMEFWRGHPNYQFNTQRFDILKVETLS